MAWVLVPSLEVVAGEQVYTALGPGRVGFTSDTFRAELEVDGAGLVRALPRCSPTGPTRADPRPSR